MGGLNFKNFSLLRNEIFFLRMHLTFVLSDIGPHGSGGAWSRKLNLKITKIQLTVGFTVMKFV